MTLDKLFERLAGDIKNGVSRWVYSTEFVGEYEKLKLGNGGSWFRPSSALAKKYIIETDRSKTSGNRIDAVRLAGFNTREQFQQHIRQDIKDFYRTKNCVMLGICGNSENTKIEIDHKDGRKDNMRVSDTSTQRLEDFQPLCKAANDVKRQICKRCKETDKRWKARELLGNPYDFYEGGEDYDENLGCVGCYQYDPVEYRIACVKRITEEASKQTTEFIMNKLYGK